MLTAPIALFVYNRPQHTKLVLEALEQNHLACESSLFVFCDGPKPDTTQEALSNIAMVLEIVKSKKWCKEVTVIERSENYGLYKSITSGVSQILERNNSIIVLEDDHVTSRWFLTYMNDALKMYEKSPQVACISGYIYPVKGKLPETFFIKGADCWGWATWRRAWKVFNPDAKHLLHEINYSGNAADFNFFDTYPYVKMLEDKIDGRNNSWAILWYASTFLKNMLTLYPGQSFVQNIGNDGSGVHCTPTSAYDVKLAEGVFVLNSIPVKENIPAKKIMAEYFRTLYPKPNLASRAKSKIKKLIGYHR